MRSDKEKLLNILPLCDDNIEDIILEFIRKYPSDFPISRLADLIEKLQHFALRPRITKSEEALVTATERALYVKQYLEGRLYTTEEAAKNHIEIQRQNATVAYEKCKEAIWPGFPDTMQKP